MRIEVALDGAQRPEFTFGTIGISATQDEAITGGLGEWYLGFGLPLFQAVRGTQATLAVADYEIFAGALGLRGSAAHSWVDGSDAMNRRILEALLPSVSKRADFITLDLKMMVPANGRPKSECRVNGSASVDIASTLLTLNWPRTPEGYIFKQAYILKKRIPSKTTDQTPPSGTENVGYAAVSDVSGEVRTSRSCGCTAFGSWVRHNIEDSPPTTRAFGPCI
jgi:hypothetical protein